MDVLNALASYSFAEIFIMVMGVVVALKFIWSLVDWFSVKLKKHFNMESERERNEQDFKNTVIEMAGKIDSKEIQFTDAVLTIKAMIDTLNHKIDDLERKEDLTQERIQQDSRAYLIDKHKRFTSNGWIESRALEDLEIRYMYYKAAGGNTFVDNLMADLRALPKTPPPQQGKEV